MKKISEHFHNDIWPLIINPAIENARKKLDKDFSAYVDLKEFDSDEYKTYLSSLYEEKRDWLKKIYFGSFEIEKEHWLDMHKISAVICRSLIGCKPFSFDVAKANKYKKINNKNDDLNWIIDNYFINYKVAVNSAFGLVLYDLLDKIGDGKSIDEKLVDSSNVVSKLTESGFDLYQKDPNLLKSEHEPFYKSMILNIAINDSNKRDFDYLGFAVNSFQLQQYEILKCQYNLLSDI